MRRLDGLQYTQRSTRREVSNYQPYRLQRATCIMMSLLFFASTNWMNESLEWCLPMRFRSMLQHVEPPFLAGSKPKPGPESVVHGVMQVSKQRRRGFVDPSSPSAGSRCSPTRLCTLGRPTSSPSNPPPLPSSSPRLSPRPPSPNRLPLRQTGKAACLDFPARSLDLATSKRFAPLTRTSREKRQKTNVVRWTPSHRAMWLASNTGTPHTTTLIGWHDQDICSCF